MAKKATKRGLTYDQDVVKEVEDGTLKKEYKAQETSKPLPDKEKRVFLPPVKEEEAEAEPLLETMEAYKRGDYQTVEKILKGEMEKGEFKIVTPFGVTEAIKTGSTRKEILDAVAAVLPKSEMTKDVETLKGLRRVDAKNERTCGACLRRLPISKIGKTEELCEDCR